MVTFEKVELVKLKVDEAVMITVPVFTATPDGVVNFQIWLELVLICKFESVSETPVRDAACTIPAWRNRTESVRIALVTILKFFILSENYL